MGIFNKLFGKDNSFEFIQCENRDSLVYKWVSKDTKKKDTIPSNSILRVNVGEVAVTFSNQISSDAANYIEGPYQNPIGEGIYDVFFINTQGTNQIRFAVPYFDVADPRNIDLMVPVTVRGSVIFCISDYKEFIRLNRLADMNLEGLTTQVKDALIRHVKAVVANIPIQHEIPLVSLESQIGKVNDIVKDELIPRFVNDFGVNLKSLDITDISIDKECEAYEILKSITQDVSVKKTLQKAELDRDITEADAKIRIKEMNEGSVLKMNIQKEEADLNLMDKRKSIDEKHRVQSESSNLDLMDKKMSIEEKFKQMREDADIKVKSQQSIIEETKFAMHSRTEEAARSGQILSDLSSPDMKNYEEQMVANLKKGIPTIRVEGGKLKQTGTLPPREDKKSESLYHIAINGEPKGPYTLAEMKQLNLQGKLEAKTKVWLKGTADWAEADTFPELSSLFNSAKTEDVPPPLS